MSKASQILRYAGFFEDAVTVTIQKRKQGIARDIVEEAGHGYNAVVARRRGMGALRGIVLGSIAHKLLEKLDFVPLLLAGRKTAGSNVLLAFDGSPGAMRAVDFVKLILAADPGFKIKLLHVIRGDAQDPSKHKGIYSPREYTEGIEKEMSARLDHVKSEFIKSGFKTDRISTKIITGAQSRAAAIVEEAVKSDCGTIVLGRRGLSQVRTFFIGRVTNKVVHMARDRTVWIVR
jgi:nucleotide-binding universal stress UspA family protein